MLNHATFGRWLIEARPARPRVELGLRIEQRRPAAHAVIRARFVIVPMLASKSALGACLARHVILLRRELLFPLGFSPLDLFCGLFHEESTPSNDSILQLFDVWNAQK